MGQSHIARVRVSRVSRLSRRAATTDLDGHVRTGSELPHGPRGSTSMQMALVSVYVGSTAVGQGLETVMTQIAAAFQDSVTFPLRKSGSEAVL